MRILVVEDSVRLAENIKEFLELERYTVDVAGDGESGVQMVAANDYDVVILDINLPKKDGMEVCKILRNAGKRVPIIMLTAQAAVEDKVDGLNIGADDYMTKPFVFEELLARIRAQTRKFSEKKNLIQIGTVVVDFVAKNVEKDGAMVKLSPKEYAIVEYLVRNKGIVKNRTEVLDHVWGVEAENLGYCSDTVEVHISYLRKKLGKSFIKTRKGFGYVVE